ncbi:MAG: calcium channel protein [Caeruleum heppii]|nr:MAG: calcium channel protein [Caeruleum heppii]
MASNHPNSRDPDTPQSIPLRNLARTQGSPYNVRHERRTSRGFSIGDQSPHGARQGSSTGALPGRRYSRLTDVSPSPFDRGRNVPRPIDAAAQHPYYRDPHGGDVSPLEDLGGFQEALGFAGLSFSGEATSTPPQDTRSFHVGSQQEAGPGLATGAPYSRLTHRVSDESQHHFPSMEEDTTPLTDPRHLQPISGAPLPYTPTRGRRANTSVRFSPSVSPGSMLGDDLPSAEAGRVRTRGLSLGEGSPSDGRNRSLSPSSAAASPLSRAGSIMRKMSQRVVNLSNEPDMVGQEIRRKPSQATMTEPPSLPAMTEYAHDDRSTAPEEKTPGLLRRQARLKNNVNPLKGKSLGIFPAENKLRKRLCDLLVHPATEPIILVLIVFQTILLAIESAPDVFSNPKKSRRLTSWIDFALLALFVIYTLEIVARVIVSGFLLNPQEYSSLDRRLGLRTAIIEKAKQFLSPQGDASAKAKANPVAPQPSILRSFTSTPAGDLDQPGHSRQQQRIRLARRAFLRHSFNRLDFVAVTSFWIAFVLGIVGMESEQHLNVFRMLSCLRILRLLGLTSGTSVILRSLKKAAPMLVNVAFLIGFFWLLFAVVGVQSFKASLRRTCVWIDPDDPRIAVTNPFQFCGGQLNANNGSAETWFEADGLTSSPASHKGFLCPRQSKCMQRENPFNGTVSFDNVLQSLQMIFVIMSSNTFSNLLYFTTESDYLAAALFFAAGIVIMSLWLINLLVAVITSSFQVIREESKASAFAADQDTIPVEPEKAPDVRQLGYLKRIYDKTQVVWILIIVAGLTVQCLRSADMSRGRKAFINVFETIVTLLLVLEIIVRIAAEPRRFWKSKRNLVDLGLAVITAVIQIPQIRNSGRPYAWLTLFQIMRIYRVVLAVSATRDLIMVVLGNVSGIANLIVFVFLITFLTAIFAVQLFRGEILQMDNNNQPVQVTFGDIYNSFLGMYQILSSENWTSIMFNVTGQSFQYGTAWIGAIFFILWFILANFIVLNMFIAVIQENFDVTEDEKRLEQVKAFLQRKDLGGSSQGNLSLSTILQLGRARRQKDPLDYGPATMEMLLKDAVVKDFLDDQVEPAHPKPVGGNVENARQRTAGGIGSVTNWKNRFLGLFRDREPNPFYSKLQLSHGYGDLDARTMAHEVVSATKQREQAQREYLHKYPRYNVALFLFPPKHPLRRFCQRIVGPGRGSRRIEGVPPIKPVWFAFSAFIYAAIVAMVLLACVTTPLYQKEYFERNIFSVKNWFVFTDVGFAGLFTIEAIIKVIADGFFWTPNAYFRGAWGFIDGLVLLTLWVNVGTSLQNEGAVSRAVGAFKALRALRLLNVSDSARDTFKSVIILGGWKVISAAFVSLSLLIPFAIYGLNLFNGQMQQCNDLGQASAITNLTADCVGEYLSNPYSWDILAPRVVANPYYDFDNFGGALFILFQIVSQEGWTDVMWQAESVTGVNRQPRAFASRGNAVFFVVFNLLGAVFVLTLFVSVFMRNYTEQTGVAFLTAEQRSWLELRKLLRQISPSKRPSNKPHQQWRSWCYRQAVKKHGRWQRLITLLLFLHLILLLMEFYPEVPWWNRTRDFIFVAFTVMYISNIIIRIIGLTWTRFRKSSWDLYSLFAVGGTTITTALLLSNFNQRVYVQLHNLFLVSIALLLIPRNNQLDQLFKTAAASLTAIGNLLATWFVLFLVYAIALTQTFGLTKFGANETGNLNLRNVPKALILLFRTSCGEGWNSIMEDFATMQAPNCVEDPNFFYSDCGSAEWARALFISWNILSMYIFVSLFVSLIYESFSYVYQRSSGLSAVSREEIRRFKQAWATYDPEGTGFIAKEAFPRLLGELSGVFEMRIYYGEHTVGAILDECRTDPVMARHSGQQAGMADGVDLAKLARRISQIPVDEIRRRRRMLNVFYEEVRVSADPDRGISFTSVLMILAHYKVISDSKSLKLEEFLRRRARLQRVEEAVRRDIVVGFFDTMYWSRYLKRFIEHRESARMNTVPTLDVPEIFIEDEDDDHPPARPSSGRGHSTSLSINTNVSPPRDHLMGRGPDLRSPTSSQLRHRADSRVTSPRASSHTDLSPSASAQPSGGYADGFDWPQPGGGLSGASSPGGREGVDMHSRQNSSVSAQDVLEVLDNSAWGESIRRSFTQRRRPSRSRDDDPFQ